MDYDKNTKRMFQVGDVVKVKPGNLDETHRYFTATDEMFRLQKDAREMKIESVRRSTKCNAGCISANNFSWHPSDLCVVDHVNTNPLVVDGPKGVFQFNPERL